MSISVVSPLNIMPTATGSLPLRPEQLELIRDVIAGRSLSRVRAINLLSSADIPDKHLDFQRLLENEGESPGIRRLCAMSLGRMNSRTAIAILVKNSQVRDETVLAGVMKALGRIGDSSAIPAILRVRDHCSGLAASQARFAASLISYRHGLEGNELSPPDSEERLQLPSSGVNPAEITRATEAEANLCLRSLAAEPFGIDYSERNLLQVKCGRTIWMVILNREFTGQDAPKKPLERKAFLGVVATKNEEAGSYSTALLLLSAPIPGSNTMNFVVPRSTGELTFSGRLRSEGGRASFSISAIPGPGSFPVRIEGTFDGIELVFQTFLSGSSVQKRREPTKERRAEGATFDRE